MKAITQEMKACLLFTQVDLLSGSLFSSLGDELRC
jgi:hypothetical protein